MQTSIYILIIVALLLSLCLAYFQYYFKKVTKLKILPVLFVLKTGSLFLLFLILINPTIPSNTKSNTKPKLVLLVDNSASLAYFKAQANVRSKLELIETNTALNQKFDIATYTFGKDMNISDTLTFSEDNTDISKALQAVNRLYKNQNVATVLITDGNQTTGNDYEFFSSKNKIFPLVAGDTTVYADIKISKLNVNKYSYLKNKFPVEVFLFYEGDKNITKTFTVTHKGKRIYSKEIAFSPNKPYQNITFYSTSEEKGIQYYKASIQSLSNEKNTKNNNKNFSVEVIDEQTKVLLLSAVMHPDLGAIKRAIETNKQRKVEIKLISESSLQLEKYQFYIFYQPNALFRETFEKVSSNYLVISGTKTDWNFINSLSIGLSKNYISKMENYSATYNPDFVTFFQGDIGFNNFPPLQDKFGEIEIDKEFQTLLYQSVAGIETEQPLLGVVRENNQKAMFLFGEGIWRWRAASYENQKSFESFDTFMGAITQYLSSNKKRNRLEVNVGNIYAANASVEFTVLYLDENYLFDPRASLQLKLKNEDTKEMKLVPFSLVQNSYQVAIEGLYPGEYAYEVQVEGQSIKRYGKLKVTPFKIEEQFTNANRQKLEKLAQKTSASLFFESQTNDLIKELIQDKSYFTTQKTKTSNSYLIDWKWILGLVVFFLSLEWFLRKYYGKI